ncbi:MAG: bifunctional oligoribonuclease/PAP phosphatase NrnA [Planctomycetaceae bacterium]|nr:bifunctional oligoribonuclease/PAP phosphatase NrnA [Planctomycetaceae bacterium]
MSKNFQKALDLINNSKSFLVTSHTRPDGDAIGCMKAFCDMAANLGKSAQPILLSPPAVWYDFLFGKPVPVLGNDVKLEQLGSGEFGSFDLIVIVDTNSYVQLPEFDKWLKTSKLPVLVIDHHVTGDGLGAVEIVDSTAAATGEIIFDLFKFAKWEITPQIAEAVYVALSTDTGWFRFDNTDSRVMRNASSLIELGAKPAQIYHKLYKNYSPARLKLLGKMLNNLEFHHDGQIALQHIMRSDFDATGAIGADTEEFVNECQRVSVVEAAALFIELKDGGFRCALRSTGRVDVQKIASELGGGGHKMASGVNLKGSLDEVKKLILDKFEKQLK